MVTNDSLIKGPMSVCDYPGPGSPHSLTQIPTESPASVPLPVSSVWSPHTPHSAISQSRSQCLIQLSPGKQ